MMALFKTKDPDTATITSSGSVVADPRKLLSLKRVQDELERFNELYERERELNAEEVVLVPPDANSKD